MYILAQKYWKYRQFCIEMFQKYPFSPSLKLFYIDNYPYITVEMFFNINFIGFEKNFHSSSDVNFKNVQFYAFSLVFFVKGW